MRTYYFGVDEIKKNKFRNRITNKYIIFESKTFFKFKYLLHCIILLDLNKLYYVFVIVL